MTIRLATAEDAAACADIYDPICLGTTISFETSPPGSAEMARRITATLPQLPWLVHVDAGRVLGYAYAHPYRERPAYRWTVECSIYVSEEARGKGIGKALYTSLLAVLAAQRYRSAVAGIALPNDGSVRLHEAVGFQRVGDYKSIGYKLGRWIDVSRWHRPLTADPGPPSEPIPAAELVGTPIWERALAGGLHR